MGIDLASQVEERSEMIPYLISEKKADIVFLQEVWDPLIRNRFITEFRALGYPFFATSCPFIFDTQAVPKELRLAGGGWGHLAFSMGQAFLANFKRAMGSGLMIFSKYPFFEKARFLNFSVNTRLDENLVTKGAIKVTVSTGSMGLVDIYNAHFGAVTYHTPKKEFDFHESRRRLQQVQEFKKWFQGTRLGPSAIVACDLNVHPFLFSKGVYLNTPSTEYSLLTHPSEGLGLLDSFGTLHGLETSAGNTDVIQNPFKRQGYFSQTPDSRIDYIFHSSAIESVFSEPVFNMGQHILSDHYGVLTQVEPSFQMVSQGFSNTILNFLCNKSR